MRTAKPMFVLSLLLIVGLAHGVEESACDLKTVEKAFLCDEHDILLPDQLASNVTYYVCGECEQISKTAGQCPECEGKLEKKTSKKGVCPHCFEKPEPVDVCVKTYYECPDCEHRGAAPGKCEHCESAWGKKTSRALIEYACPECSSYSYKPGKCKDEDCERKGKPLERTCSESGTFPHCAAMPKSD
jgi:hypothetical protein